MLSLASKTRRISGSKRFGSSSDVSRYERRNLFGWGKSKPEKPDSTNCETKGHVHGPNCGHSRSPVQKPASAAPTSRSAASSMPILSNLKRVKHIIAVSSGKGGVGKSTVAVNLSLAFSQIGKRVGLLDADIYGPSIPTMMNLVAEKPKVTETTNRLIPLVNYGVECMSMGFLVPQDTATIWRGPMVMSALDQMLHEVEWSPDLDLLVIDMPPGTGDAQISISQRTPLSGAVIVSTPQEVALADVRRGANMFRKVNVPLLGIIENMAYFKCGKCDEKHYLFGEGGAKKTAGDLNIDILGEIPIEQSIRELCDSGKPTVASSPDSPSAAIYRQIAQDILNKLDKASTSSSAPKITIED